MFTRRFVFTRNPEGELAMFSEIITPIISLGGLSLILGVGLVFFSKKFSVEEDPLKETLKAAMPGVNCGACGFAGCDAFAEAIFSSTAKITDCPVGGSTLADNLAEIMGVAPSVFERRTAFVKCIGCFEKSSFRYIYNGIAECNIAMQLASGPKACAYGCQGGGSCIRVCAFDAIKIVNGIAIIDAEKCTACLACIDVCPNKLIDLAPYEKDIRVACASKDFGKAVKAVCTVGCIGCKLCAKACPTEAIAIEDNLARINYDKCTLCGVCVDKCPAKVIIKS